MLPHQMPAHTSASVPVQVILGMLAAVSVCGVAYVSTNGGSSATPDNIDGSTPVGSTTVNSSSSSSSLVEPDDTGYGGVGTASQSVNLRPKVRFTRHGLHIKPCTSCVRV